MDLIFEKRPNSPLSMGEATATFIKCDTCGNKIVGQESGIVIFPHDRNYQKEGSFFAIHKGTCETDRSNKSRWQDLDSFLRDIVGNSAIDLAVTERRITGPDGLAEAGLHS